MYVYVCVCVCVMALITLVALRMSADMILMMTHAVMTMYVCVFVCVCDGADHSGGVDDARGQDTHDDTCTLECARKLHVCVCV
jgi:hypothetical protein